MIVWKKVETAPTISLTIENNMIKLRDVKYCYISFIPRGEFGIADIKVRTLFPYFESFFHYFMVIFLKLWKVPVKI